MHINILYKVFNHKERRKILQLILKNGEVPTAFTDIRKLVQKEQPTVSHHMTILYTAGIVERHMEGLFTFYRIPDQKEALVQDCFDAFEHLHKALS